MLIARAGVWTMAIPDDKVIQRELLLLIAAHADKRVLASDAYDPLARAHPELTLDERTKKYRNSTSKWANSVQWARQHLVDNGVLYRARTGPNPQHGYWILTPNGEKEANAIVGESRRSSVEIELESQVAADLESARSEETFEEGATSAKLVAYYERNPKIRASAIRLHGTTCKACGFNFEQTYGARGKDFIEVHHLVPISTYIEATGINPESDLTVLCSNCHRIVHRIKDNPLSLEQLKELIEQHVDPLKS